MVGFVYIDLLLGILVVVVDKINNKLLYINKLKLIMINLINYNFQAHPFHLVFPLPLPILRNISQVTLTSKGVLTNLGFSFIILKYLNILLSILDFLRLCGFVFINKKRGSEEQSTDKTEDKEIENKQAKNLLNDTLKKLNDLEEKKVPEDLDKGKPVRPKDYKTAKDIEEQYPDFFDEDSGNSENKKEGYSQLKEYLQEELDSLPSTKETSTVEESNDRDTKRPKPSSNEIKEEALASQGKEKSTSSESSEGKGKGSLIDDYADPSNEFGD